jgi:predicted nucleic acid-binding protein
MDRLRLFVWHSALFALMLAIALGIAVPAVAQTGATSPDGWVVLSVSEYTALKRAASPADPEPEPPPVEATLSRIDYNLKIDGDLATGEARLTVDVIKGGWVRVPLPEGLMVRDAQLDGRPVNLVTRPTERGHARLDLLLSTIGRSVLALKIVAPVNTVAGTDVLQLPVSNSAVSHATIELLKQGVDVRITGGLLLKHSESATGSYWIANGKGGEPLTFAWRRRVDDLRLNQPLRLRGVITQLLGLGEDATQVNAEVQLEVLQGLAQDVRVRLPEQFTVNQVSGAMVSDWEVTNQDLQVSFMTRLPPEFRLSPADAATLLVDEILARLTVFDLPAADRPALVRAAVDDRIAGGRFYDAHIAAVARAAGATVIVTDNRRHFLTSLRHGIRVETPAEFAAGLRRTRR